jgi:hypothetical protein
MKQIKEKLIGSFFPTSPVMSFIFFMLVMIQDIFACPMCSEAGPRGKNPNVTYVLIAFILSIYLAYYFIFRVIRKYSQMNSPEKRVD